MGLITKLNNIATAISNKTGQPASEYTLDNMPTAIGAIQTSFPAPTTTDKPVRFIDYDGTIVSEMTYEQAAALTSLPEGPTHTGLTFTNWTSTLAAVQSVTSPNRLDVGAIYEDATSHDNATVMTVCPQKATTAGTITLNFNQSVANGVTIDWGDGSATETVAGTGNVTATHAYSGTLAEDYDISLSPASGCQLTLGGGTSSTALMGNSYYALKSIRVGNATLAQHCFYQCYSLTEAILSTHIGETLPDYAFSSCLALTSVVIPNSVTSIGGNAFSSCYALTEVGFGNRTANMPTSSWMSSDSRIERLDFTECEQIPNLTSSSFFSNMPAYTKIVVPDSLYDNWIIATNWSSKASQIVKESEE